MLEVLRHQELEGVLATVVRYYGGIQLGAGGLVRAYTDSVAQALKTLEKVPLVRRSLAEGTVPYEWEGVVRRLLGNHGAQLKDVQHGSTVRMVISVTADQLQTMLDALNESTQGQSQWRVLETVDRATR